MYIRNRLNALGEPVDKPKDYVVTERDTLNEVLAVVYAREAEQRAG